MLFQAQIAHFVISARVLDHDYADYADWQQMSDTIIVHSLKTAVNLSISPAAVCRRLSPRHANVSADVSEI